MLQSLKEAKSSSNRNIPKLEISYAKKESYSSKSRIDFHLVAGFMRHNRIMESKGVEANFYLIDETDENFDNFLDKIIKNDA